MAQVKASAPGKLVLSGEYAVLDGAPAICMAVDRRAHVTVSQSGADCHTVVAPGFSSATGRFNVSGEEFEWLANGDEFALVEHVWRTANATPPGYLALTLDSSDFADAERGVKIGVGSSAALAVCLAKALGEIASTDADATSVAFAAHRQFQRGLGSGVDVACSTLGGLVEYAMGAGPGRRIEWPDGLEFAVFWAGVPVSTSEKLEQLRRQPARPSRAALVLASRRLASDWAGGAAPAILDGYRDYISALREFSLDHDLGIFDAGHAELADAAAAAGVVYKPCGAGGGDTGIVLSCDKEAVNAFVGIAQEMNIQLLDIGIDEHGVLVEREQP